MTTSDLIYFIELNGLRTDTIAYFLECSTDGDKARLHSIERQVRVERLTTNQKVGSSNLSGRTR